MLATLSRVFGFTQLRPGQQLVVEAVLAGRSAAAIFPTGSGKSLCYQLPALHLPHLTLVVSPLLALMQDQLAFLHARGISAASGPGLVSCLPPPRRPDGKPPAFALSIWSR